MFFTYEAFLILILILFFLSYSRLKIDNKVNELQHQNIIVNNLIDTMDDGFYIWDAKKRIEKFSPNLLISLNTVFYSFNEFIDFFEQSEILMKNFTEAKEINKSFTLDLKAKDSEVYCMCYGRSIIDNANKVIGALLWIRNVSDYKIRANELEIENRKFVQEIENYKNIFNSLPYPIFKYNKHRKVKFYNLFYDKYINSSQRLAITRNVYNTKPEKHVITCKSERKIFSFAKASIQDSDEIVVYGQDVSYAEKLHTELNDYLVTQRNLLEGLPVAIAIYSKNQKLKFYNNAFTKAFQFDSDFLASHPTYHEVMLYLFESKKLLKEEDFQDISKQRHTLFKELIGSYNNVLHLTNGKLLRVFTVPYAAEGLLFSYEESKKL
ncbi:hypothetical protein IC220_02945 [Wolbachia endosymbiont of Pentalonia nigronervosa]|uniref:hypothetical protein n=1 Tax=Wolbachia endosymbiont of Pentalonia nigronervosa TaxID=1301914 RepID=UPI00165F584A|nr:hypothetical protein [Wolbachia endosymbiont of Pentalonia nigronervosa]MBD0391416.1 hypothetical protein [Wolbachia endosymbiont of Pentalonia nigronervosa]